MTQEQGDAIIESGAKALAHDADAKVFICIATFGDGRMPLVLGNAPATVMLDIREFLERRYGVFG